MRVGIGLIVLALLAWGTARQLPRFRTDLALWGAAVRVTPMLPRPALNYATALRKIDRHDEAVFWLIRAGQTADRSLRAQEIRAGVRGQLQWMSAFGDDVCSRPDVQPYCS
jgi:hypothetical protein